MWVLSYFLCLLQKSIFHFIWANKQPRISRATLLAHRLQGGLGVPNITEYYPATDVPLWVLLELPHPRALLRMTHDFSESDFLRYLQIQHWLTSLRETSTYPFKKTAFEHTLQHSLGSLSLISALYASLSNRSSFSPLTYVTQWKQDLTTEIDLVD